MLCNSKDVLGRGGGILRSDDFAVSLGRDGKDIDAAEGAACYDMNRHDINDQ